MAITFGSVCSGIEAASVAWHPLGFRASWLSEIEAFPSAVLATRWPEVPNLGDMTKLARQVLVESIPAPEVLVGGTPCQAFSVAGMREGLADPRGALTIKYVELLDAIDHVRTKRGQPEAVCLWENVPGVLSDKGNAFGCFLSALVGESEELQPPGGKWKDAGCVYGPTRTAAWRVLDAQYFGLAQRRRRVFVVASARAGFDPAAVLFESEGVRRDHPPSRGAGENPTGTIAGGARRNGGYSTDDIPLTAATITANYGKDGGARAGNDCQPVNLIVAGTLQANGKAAGSATQQDAESGLLVVHGTQDPCVDGHIAHALGRNHGQENAVLAFSCKDYGADATRNLSPTLRAMGHGESHANAGGQVAVAFAIQAGALRTNPLSGPDGVGVQADHAYTLEARAEVQAVCVTGEVTHTLKAEGFDASEDGTGRGQPIVAATGDSYACTTKSNTVEALRALREEVGAEAFTQWGLGVLDSLQSSEVLRQGLHGCCIRCQACERESGLDDGAPPCPQVGSGGGVCQMRKAGRQRRSPQGRQLAEQLSRQLGADLSKLPPQGTSAKVFLHDLWEASEGLWLLREALSALQEMGQHASNEAQPAQRSAVRRLTPRETERLQGFPDDWTLIPWRGKPADECPDGPRYKAIGNSKAIPVVRWIGKRLLQQLQA